MTVAVTRPLSNRRPYWMCKMPLLPPISKTDMSPTAVASKSDGLNDAEDTMNGA